MDYKELKNYKEEKETGEFDVSKFREQIDAVYDTPTREMEAPKNEVEDGIVVWHEEIKGYKIYEKENFYTDEQWEEMGKYETDRPITLLDKHKKAW